MKIFGVMAQGMMVLRVIIANSVRQAMREMNVSINEIHLFRTSPWLKIRSQDTSGQDAHMAGGVIAVKNMFPMPAVITD